jgi:hypothetical protein
MSLNILKVLPLSWYYLFDILLKVVIDGSFLRLFLLLTFNYKKTI